MIDVLKSQRVNVETLTNGAEICRSPKKHVLIKSQLMEGAWTKYNEKKMNGNDLLEVCSSLVTKFTEEFEYTILDYSTSMLTRFS